MSGDTVSIVDLLGCFPSEGAVFTTFTLSLTWFETHLLRALERQGGRRIAVLADPMGVQQSLKEGLAAGPGLRYALEPVSMPSGFFHPKVALVWGPERIVLAVGSGNLTMTGMQRNAELWEVLVAGEPGIPERQQLSQVIARGAVAFFSALRARLDAGGWSGSLLREAEQVLGRWMPALLPDNGIQWLDTLGGRSIGEQVVEAAGPAQGQRTLQFLSPFHKEGTASQRLARELGVSAAELLFVGEKSSFPLHRVQREADVPFSSRRLSVADRPLHAKLYHVAEHNGDSIVVSGSANATKQALWTPHNAEVCLLRRASTPMFSVLLAGEPATPDFQKERPVVRELCPLTIDWARASREGVVARLSWRSGAPPQEVEVLYVETDEGLGRVPWPTEPLRLALPADFDPMRPAPVRLEVVAVDGDKRHMARAWVSFDEWLLADPTWRRAMTTWSRLLGDAGGNEDEDEAELLRIFGEEHSRTMATLGAGPVTRASRRGGSSGRGGRSQAPSQSISVQLLLAAAATADVGIAGQHQLGAARGGMLAGIHGAMLSAFRVLDRSPTSSDGGEDDGATPPPRSPPLTTSVRASLRRFEDRFREACRELTEPPPHPAQVLAYAVLVVRLSIRFRLREEDGRASLWASLGALANALLGQREVGPPVLSLLSGDGLPDEVTGLFAGLIALIAWCQRGGRLEGQPAAPPSLLSARALRECLATLERATGEDVAPLLPAALRDVFPGEQAALVEALSALRAQSAPSERTERLRQAAEVLLAGDSFSVISRRFRRSGAPLDDDERAMLQRAGRGQPPLLVRPWVEHCAGCHQRISSASRQRLHRREPIQCTALRCRRWLLPSEDR